MAVRMLDKDTLNILASTPVSGRTLVSTPTIKAWAGKNGYKVTFGRKGRMAREVVDAFNSAHKTKQYLPSQPAQDEQTFTYTGSDGRKRKFKAQTKVMRAWAQAQPDLTVGQRGRFTQDVIDAYGRFLRESE